MRNIFVIILIFSLFNVEAQNIKRVLKQMDKKEFDKAIEYGNKILKKTPDHTSANFCLAWCYYNKKNYLDAYKYILQYKANENGIDAGNQEELLKYMEKVMTRTRKKPFDFRTKYIYQKVKEAAINYVREKRDPEIASKYIEMFPNSPYLKNTIHIRNHYAYEKAREANTIEAFSNFIEKYPNAAQISLAKENIHELEFQKAKSIGTVDAINNFIKKYPNSEQYTKAVMLRNELAFQIAKKQNTLESIGAFINNYPNALQLAEAHRIKQQLVFEKAKQINTIDAYSDFVKQYPFGKYYVDIFNLKSIALGSRIITNSGIQNVKFSRAYDYNKTVDNYSCSAADAKGNVYIAGTVDLKEHGRKDVWILKIDNKGKMVWNKRFGTANNDELIDIYVKDSSIIGIGNYAYTDTTPGKTWVLNINTNGSKNWMKLFELFHPKTSVMINNSIYLGGYIDNDTIKNMAINKIDLDADKIWSRSYVTVGAVNSIIKYDDNIAFCGANWICTIDTSGYILNDNFVDSTINLISLTKKNTSVMALGADSENKLVVYNGAKNEIEQTEFSLSRPLFDNTGGVLGIDKSDNLVRLTNDLSQKNIISKNVGNYKMYQNSMFFSAKKTVLSGDIVYVKF